MNLKKYIKEFNKTFDLDIKEITDEQYFRLSYIAVHMLHPMNCYNDLDDYKRAILYDLMSWYDRHMDDDYNFNDPDWAEDVKMAIREIFYDKL